MNRCLCADTFICTGTQASLIAPDLRQINEQRRHQAGVL